MCTQLPPQEDWTVSSYVNTMDLFDSRTGFPTDQLTLNPFGNANIGQAPSIPVDGSAVNQPVTLAEPMSSGSVPSVPVMPGTSTTPDIQSPPVIGNDGATPVQPEQQQESPSDETARMLKISEYLLKIVMTLAGFQANWFGIPFNFNWPVWTVPRVLLNG